MRPILIIGAGAREHALAKAIRKTNDTVAYAPNQHPGLTDCCKKVLTSEKASLQDLIVFAKEYDCQACIIGSESYLEKGFADAFNAAGIPCLGPTKALARIETSKSYARKLAHKYIPKYCPRFGYFTNNHGLKAWIEKLGDYVIKYDGLLGGKGVWVKGDHFVSDDEALSLCHEITSHHKQGFLIEERLSGPEFSLISLSDGNSVAHFPAVQDHKRAWTKDCGPNTGGMGSYSEANHRLSFLTQSDIETAQKINEHILTALQSENGVHYCGVLYGGFMKTHQGVRLIEHNARFGDPEVINLVAISDFDWAQVILACLKGELGKHHLSFKPKASVCKYVVPAGYPQDPKQGFIDIGKIVEGSNIFYGAITPKKNRLWMTGSRALCVCATGDRIDVCADLCEQTIRSIKGNCYHRNDIASPSLMSRWSEYFA